MSQYKTHHADSDRNKTTIHLTTGTVLLLEFHKHKSVSIETDGISHPHGFIFLAGVLQRSPWFVFFRQFMYNQEANHGD